MVRKSEKLLIGVLVPWVQFDSNTMRMMCWELKDGEDGGLKYTVLLCMQTGSGAVVKAREQRVAEEHEDRNARIHGVLRDENRLHDSSYVYVTL